MNIWERIKRLWATPDPPDHPLTEQEREQIPPDNAYDELADVAANLLGHGDRDVKGKLD